VAVNGDAASSRAAPETRPEGRIPVSAGAYLELRREWRAGDVVTLDFDMRCRLNEGPRGVNRAGDGRVAVTYGPVVLTREERRDPSFDEPADIQADADGTIHASLIQPPSGARVAFEIPLRGGGSILMTDYASADCWDGSRIRTWIAKPVDVA
jgi:hypothetical protein